MLEYYEIQEYVTEVAAVNYPFRVIDAVTARYLRARHSRRDGRPQGLPANP